MKQLFLFSALFLSASFLKAQATSVSAGGDASSSSGSASYSVGQVDYTFINGSNATLTEGVQQPFEIFVITGITQTSIGLNYNVYPNPSSDFVILTTEDAGSKTASYSVYNEEGKILSQEQIQSNSTTIPLGTLSSGIYFITVTDHNNKEVKSFKVLKNK